MKKISTLACVIGAAATATTAAATDIYTNPGDFLNNTLPGYYHEDFAGVPTGGPHGLLSFGPVNGFSYTVDTVNGSGLFNDPGLVSTTNVNDLIRITFTGDPVTAVGGTFWGTDLNYDPVLANVVLTLSDGTVEPYTTMEANTFRGFTTTGAPITSLTIDATGLIENAWPTMGELYVGQVIPAPSAFGLLALSVLAAARRRR